MTSLAADEGDRSGMRHCRTDRPSARIGSTTGFADLELAKWLALAAMAIDHYGKIVEPGLFEVTHAIGRISFPLFAAIIGMRLAVRPDLAFTYARRLLFWAIVSQPVFVFVGRDWYDGNILFTLLVGVLAATLLRDWMKNRTFLPMAGVLVLLPIAWICEFSIVGAAMIPAIMVLTWWRDYAGPVTAGPLGVAANGTFAWPWYSLIDLAALPASFVMMTSVRLRLQLPRLPAQVFYGFYPAHLLALHFIDIGF